MHLYTYKYHWNTIGLPLLVLLYHLGACELQLALTLTPSFDWNLASWFAWVYYQAISQLVDRGESASPRPTARWSLACVTNHSHFGDSVCIKMPPRIAGAGAKRRRSGSEVEQGRQALAWSVS